MSRRQIEKAARELDVAELMARPATIPDRSRHLPPAEEARRQARHAPVESLGDFYVTAVDSAFFDEWGPSVSTPDATCSWSPDGRTLTQTPGDAPSHPPATYNLSGLFGAMLAKLMNEHPDHGALQLLALVESGELSPHELRVLRHIVKYIEWEWRNHLKNEHGRG